MTRLCKSALVCAAVLATALAVGCSEQKQEEKPATPPPAATEAPKPAEPPPAETAPAEKK